MFTFLYMAPEEMDWDKNGMVSFKEFLFAFTRWVGIDENEDNDEWGLWRLVIPQWLGPDQPWRLVVNDR